jgi:hypothetical protein
MLISTRERRGVARMLLSRSEQGNARQWLANLIDTLKQEDQVTVFVTLWAIWHARRKAIHEQQFQSPLTTHLFVQRFIADLKCSKTCQPKKPAAQSAQASTRWIPPPPGMVKINVDAAVGKATGRGAVATVARSESGMFLGASTVVLLGKTDPVTLETLACREALSLAYGINAHKIRVASDCRSVVQSIQGGH